MSEIDVQNHVADYYVEKRYKGIGLKYHSEIIKEMMGGINGRILDVGCGMGIIHDLFPGHDITGIDCSPGMLRHHKGKYLLASATKIPFPDGAMDSVVCRSVLHHLENPSMALKEIVRVLKPGGKFVCWETNKSWLATLVRRFTQHGDRFSEYHTAFDNLPELIGSYFGKENIRVKYQGFMAYPAFGFPDIVDCGRFLRFAWNPLMWFDEMLSYSPLKKLGFAVMIKGTKREDKLC